MVDLVRLAENSLKSRSEFWEHEILPSCYRNTLKQAIFLQRLLLKSPPKLANISGFSKKSFDYVEKKY
ncbi:MAG: hypothetical protein IJV70_00950, partial [Clostridia bacterium]|nr:hypothetical protein [Clostridia bacterium]